jgi:hypothetical protein
LTHQVQCPDCGEVFPHLTPRHKEIFRVHKHKHRFENFACDCPDGPFADAQAKRAHVMLVHSDGKYEKCERCTYIGQVKDMAKHVKENHQTFICDTCGKVFWLRYIAFKGFAEDTNADDLNISV